MIKINMAVFKVAKSGKDAFSTDERDLAFSSKFDYLKEVSSGLADTDTSGNLTITHNLGYVPAFTVFMADYSDQSIWHSYDQAGDIYATSTQLIIGSAMGGIKSKIYYALFSSEL